jgi:hypothetical protein
MKTKRVVDQAADILGEIEDAMLALKGSMEFGGGNAAQRINTEHAYTHLEVARHYASILMTSKIPLGQKAPYETRLI